MKVENNEEYEYLEVDVTKVLFSTVYLKVPKGFDRNLLKLTKILTRAAKETCDKSDWDGWSEDVEVGDIKETSEKYATVYRVYDVSDDKGDRGYEK